MIYLKPLLVFALTLLALRSLWWVFFEPPTSTSRVLTGIHLDSRRQMVKDPPLPGESGIEDVYFDLHHRRQ